MPFSTYLPENMGSIKLSPVGPFVAGSFAELTLHPEVRAEVERTVAALNERVSRVENIRKWTILPSEWTAESEELTPTLKLKRRVILQKYAPAIDEMYGEADPFS